MTAATESIAGYPLSPQQEHLWFLGLDEGGSFAAPGLVAQGVVELTGALDPEALWRALDAVVGRHEILRTAFRRAPGLRTPLQVPAAAAAAARRAHEAGPDGAGDRAVDELLRRAAAALEPEAGRVLVAELVRRGAGRHQLLLTASALCADAASLECLVRELAAAYGGSAPAEEALQYAVFADWQNELLMAEEAEAGRRFWRDQERVEPAAQRLPDERAAAGGPFSPASRPVPLPAAVAAGLRRLAVPAEFALAAAWSALLARLMGRTRITLGYTFDGRSEEELTGAVGPFARVLPVHVDVAPGDTLATLARRLAERVAECAAWQEVFAWAGEGPGAAAYLPHAFAAARAPVEAEAGGVRFSLRPAPSAGDRFHLRLTAIDHGDLLELALDHDPRQVDDDLAGRLAERLATLLGSALAGLPLGEAELIGRSERARILALAGRAERGAEICLHELAERQARTTPDRVAVVQGGRHVTFAQLERRADRLAAALAAAGVAAGDRVAVCAERSPELVASLLAVLKAGAAYVPVDPDYPRERVALLLADCRPRCVLATRSVVRERVLPEHGASPAVVVADRPPAAGAAASGRRPAVADAVAYVLYTSGSTGRPKGVAVAHRAIVNRLLWMQDGYPLGADDRLLQKTTFGFDASIWELFLPLATGARLVLARPGGQRDPAYLVAALERHGITVLQGVPSLLAALAEQPGLARCGALRRVFSGGEALPTALADQLHRLLPGAELANLYGPTETAIDATCWRYRPGIETPVAPIGRPLTRLEVHLLGPDGRHVPLGAPGELVVAGAGLARGYFERPAQTAERFRPHPFAAEGGARCYRTGDLARWRPDGDLEFLGRRDHQVKVRGFRIELGEVEATLAAHPGVAEAVVDLHAGADGEPRLAAWIVPRAGAAPAAGRYRLPDGVEVAHLNRGETEWLYREIFEEDAYSRHGIELTDEACVFDVGANIGLFSLFVGQRFPRARIHAFEPMPATFAKLSENIDLHGLAVRAHRCALADAGGRAEFTFYPQVSASSGRYADAEEDERVTRAFLDNLDPALAAFRDELMAGRFVAERVEVELRTLSDVLRESGEERIDLLKIDVEKSELDVLRGVAADDWPKVRQVVLEVHDRDGSLDAVRSLLRDRGFEVAVEEAALLRGTGLVNVYARRPGAAPAGGVALDRAPAAVAAPAGRPPTVAELRAFLLERLPDYMLPSAFALLAGLPRTPSGKVDRRALPAPAAADAAADRELPRTPVEELLASLWCELLGRERIGRGEDFFDLGGHSLLATRAATRVRDAFGLELPLTTLFDASTLAELAAEIEARLGGGGGVRPPLGRAPRDRPLPVSFAQRRLWFIDRLRPGEPLYNIPVALRLTGRLDRAALVRAFDEVVRRHEVLRTTFHEEGGEPVQRVHRHRRVAVPVIDLGPLAREARERRVRALASEYADSRFDLAAGPLWRTALVALGAEEHVALFTCHHIVGDGGSMEALTAEVAALYAAFLDGRPSPLPALPAQYADFASWQRRWLQGAVLDEQLAYWRERLRDAPQRVALPADRPEPERPSHRGGRVRFDLEAALYGRLRELARERRSTLYMVLVAAFQALLYRYSGQEWVSVGTPVANRQHAETEPLIGCFVNTLVLCNRTGDNPTFAELLARVRRATLEAHAHQDLPFERLVEALKPERTPGATPFINVWFVFQNRPQATFELPHLMLSPQPVERASAQFDLVLAVTEGDGAASAALTYSADRFEAGTAEQIAGHFKALLESVAAQPELPLLDLPLAGAPAGEPVAAPGDAPGADFQF